MERTNTLQPHHDIPPSIRHIRETLARFKREREHTALVRQPKPAQLREVRPDMVRRLDIAPHLISPMDSYAHRLTSDSEAVVEASGTDVLARHISRRSHYSTEVAPSLPTPAAEDDFGGFPGVREILSRVLKRFSPRLEHKLRRTLTVPRTETLVPQAGRTVITPEGPVKSVPYFSFPVRVRRNSTFHGLTEENIEELGGVEYRALSALMWLIPVVSSR